MLRKVSLLSNQKTGAIRDGSRKSHRRAGVLATINSVLGDGRQVSAVPFLQCNILVNPESKHSETALQPPTHLPKQSGCTLRPGCLSLSPRLHSQSQGLSPYTALAESAFSEGCEVFIHEKGKQ